MTKPLILPKKTRPSILEQIAQHQDDLYAEERKYNLAIVRRRLERLSTKEDTGAYVPFLETLYRKALPYLTDSDKEWSRLYKSAHDNVYGDPQMLDQQYLRHMSVRYWNPEAKPIRIENLGLYINGELVKYIDPGDSIMIPRQYTLGGIRSVINTTAPQLRSLPGDEVYDTLLDLRATSFIEWCQFQSELHTSSCCSKQVAWSDEKCSCVCYKCLRVVS